MGIKLRGKPRKSKGKAQQEASSESKADNSVREVEYDDVVALIKRLREANAIDGAEHDVLTGILDTLVAARDIVGGQGKKIERLQALLFGLNNEKTAQIVKNIEAAEAADSDDDGEEPADKPNKRKKRTSGRIPAKDYTGADTVEIEHESLKHKDPCPECGEDSGGKVYVQKTPKTVVRVRGLGPFEATVYKMEQLRCHVCGAVFTAQSPDDVGDEKYDETVSTMIAMLRYGGGMPHHRLAEFTKLRGIPLPTSTQWALVRNLAERIEPVFITLHHHAAQADTIYIDDTSMKVLDLHAQLAKEMEDEKKADKKPPKGRRTATRTSAAICEFKDGRRIAIFRTGWNHAGDHIAQIVALRNDELGPPIQMADALAANTAHEVKTIVAKCIVHARRNFVKIAEVFPDEVVHFLQELSKVYQYEHETALLGLGPQARLVYHQERSKPVMDALLEWMNVLTKDKKVEPNSRLGSAFAYFIKHWDGLTRFLVTEGAPLDNNIVERGVKRIIQHRKNSLFYKSATGAKVGDMFHSLIYTCELLGTNPWDYLLFLASHPNLEEKTDSFMPWNYTEAILSEES